MRVITIDITFVSSNVHDTTFDPYGHLVEPIFPTSFLYDLSLVPRPQKLVVGVAWERGYSTKTRGGNGMAHWE